jgi:hypothetical protein
MFEWLPHEWSRAELLDSKIMWHCRSPSDWGTNTMAARPLYSFPELRV